jgi:hypothetical protein
MEEWGPLRRKGSVGNVLICGAIVVIAFAFGLGGDPEAIRVGFLALGLELVFVGVLVWVRRQGA